ncbi:MAG: cell filamentation protein Fic [Bacteroidetes bacterium B1(2017)]|nr:MAG: cell filamentation protein Fic [Bacteroidetes bacterium B1(2017)]
MENISRFQLQEVLFSSQDPKVSNQLKRLLSKGKIRKIAPRIFTSNFDDPIETIIRRNLFHILGTIYPGTLLSHRSALEFKPSLTGQLFLSTTYTKKVKLPGISLQFLEGPKPIEGDTKLSGELFVSQKARALLENLQVSRKTGDESKCLSINELEEKLEQIIRINGELELNKLRDQARSIAQQLNMTKEFEKLNRLISALLTTKTSKILSSPIAKARAFGLPYDPHRLTLFEDLFRQLKSTEFPLRIEQNTTPTAFRNFAFFESYFSNYIEGTVFEIEEAKKIIQTNKPILSRNDDSHDVLGTYELVSSLKEMQITPTTPDEFLTIICDRHSILLRARPAKKPGLFKDKNNFAGSTSFVDFNLVRGTLIKSFDYYNALNHPFSKAAFIMFVISEVHPFLDGNGRIARIMMNAELVKMGQSKIIIPTVFREDYIGALKKLTKKGKADTYIKMLQRAQEFSANIFGDEMDEMEDYLISCNAFKDDSEFILKIPTRKKKS